MKNLSFILAVYLFFGSIMPHADVSQYGRFVELVSHYLQHVEEALNQEEAISFWSHLYVHCIGLDEHENDDHQDQHNKLPFRSINLGFTVFISSDNVIDPFSIRPTQHKNGVHVNPFHLTGFPSSVFQPPTRI